jgi:hypothetical protein
MKIGAIFSLLTVLAGALPAGTASDVRLFAGYLIMAGSDRTEIFDLTVSPMRKVSEIAYPRNRVPINMELEKNRLFIYHYLSDSDNGIYIYDITAPENPVFLNDIREEGYLIQGGFVAHGQWHLAQGGRFFVRDDYVYFFRSNLDAQYHQYYNYIYRFGINSGETASYTDDWRDFDSDECWPGPHSYGLDMFMAENGENIWIKSSWEGCQLFAELEDFLDNGSACFADVAWTPAPAGGSGGPIRFIDHFAVLRGFGAYTGWVANYSGFQVIEPYQYRGGLYFLSDFACPWSVKHDGKDSGITYENAIYDVQDILVKNGDIFLTSYFTKSVPYTYFYQDWNGYMTCQPEKWEFYDLESHPYGMAAANGVLYVAAEDGLHQFPLIHPDESLPVGYVNEVILEGNHLEIKGTAKDSEGIRAVYVRLGNAYLFKARERQDTSNHRRPVAGFTYRWELSLTTEAIAPGEYDIKAIAEDADGDFTAIDGGTIRINPMPMTPSLGGAQETQHKK